VDQGWGNFKGQVDFKLCRGQPDPKCVNVDEWNEQGSGTGSHVVWREVVANATHKRQQLCVNLQINSPFIGLFQLGD